jgi:putative aldouronate transport system permease protein
MIKDRSVGSRLFDLFNYLFMLALVIVMLYPFLGVISLSISEPAAITKGLVTWHPVGFNTEGYRLILENEALWRTYGNTILYAAVGTGFMLLFTSLIAYALSIKEFVLKKFLTVFLSITMFFGGGMIPTFLLIKDLGLIDSFWVMVIPGCVSAYNVIIFRTFFQGIPSELRESAYIDGANDIVILFRIILPLSSALLAVFALFSIIGHWNSWFSALIYLKDASRWPLQMLLRQLVVQDNMGNAFAVTEISEMISKRRLNPKNIQNAAVVVTMFPIICVYPFIQKYFVKGVMIGSIKG